MNIAIVEDDLFAANYLKKLVEKEGFCVKAIFDNAYDTIEFCKKNRVDIVLIDVMLKGPISGAEAALTISTIQPHIDIIFLTAYASEEIYSYAMRAKAKAYLLKPYRDFEILSTIKLVAHNKTTQKKDLQEEISLINGYRYNRTTKKIYLHSNEIVLGKKASLFFDILSKNLFSYHPSSSIVPIIWGIGGTNEALRSLVHRIRKKTVQDLILSNKYGYKFNISSL